MGVLKRTATKCRDCPFSSKCNRKRLEAEGYLEPSVADITMSTQEELLVKHDYRDIKIAEGTTVTVDVEKLKKEIEESFYRSAGLGINYGA